MPLAHRKLIHYKDQYLWKDHSPEVLSSNDLIQLRHHTDLIGTLKQLDQLSTYSMDIFENLIQSATETHSRLKRLSRMTDNVVERLNSTNTSPMLNEKSPTKAHKQEVTHSPETLFSQENMPVFIQELYSQCLSPPNLHQLNNFRTDGQSCLKQYSNPDFFTETWMIAESLRQKQLMEERKQRRQQRRARKAKEKDKKAKTHNQNTISAKDKVITLKSWKDLYGTGEGSEFEHRRRKSSLQEHQNPIINIQSHDTIVSPDIGQQNDSEMLASVHSIDKNTGSLELDNESFIDRSISMHPIYPDPSQGPKSPPPPPPPTPPKISETIPPPPTSPPPELNPIINSSVIHEPTAIDHSKLPQSPPPPPPIPESEDKIENKANQEVSTPKLIHSAPKGLLMQIQQGKLLRHSKENETKKTKPVPLHNALLQQIQSKQNLRHVEAVRKRSKNLTSVGGTIAEILARRAVIAYESNSSDDDSDTDWC